MSSDPKVKFIIRGDAHEANKALDDLTVKMNGVGEASENLSNYIIKLFGADVIKDAIEKMGNYGLEIQKAANGLGVSAETLQSYKILANNAQVAEDTVTSFYSSLQTARQNAIDGDSKSIQMLQALGITYKQIMSTAPTATLMGNIISNTSNGNIAPGSAKGRAVEGIFGPNSIPNFQQVINTAAGQTPEKYGEKSGQLSSNKDIQEIANIWTDTLNDLKSALVKMIPIGKLLLSIVDTVANAIAGLAEVIGDVLKGQWSGAFKKLGRLVAEGIMTITDDFLSVIDWSVGWVRKIPVIGKHISQSHLHEAYEKGMVRTNKWLGIDAETQKQGSALGQVGEMALMGGADTLLAKTTLGKSSITKLFKGKELVNAEQEAVTAKKIETMVKDNFDKKSKEYFNARTTLGKDKLDEMHLSGKGPSPITNEDFENLEKSKKYNEEKQAIVEKLKGGIIKKFLLKGGPVLEGVSISQFLHGINNPQVGAQSKGNLSQNPQPVVLPLSISGGNSSNLKFGGIYSTGIQNQLIQLNMQMRDLLQQIVKNTSYNNPYTQTNTLNGAYSPSGL